jgi:predicted PurR-regulated permease PerM
MSNGNGLKYPETTTIIHSATRRQTRRIVFVVTTILVVMTGGFLIWSLRPIILPIIIGTLAAYICFPLLKLFNRTGIPRGAGILLLFGSFFFVIIIIANQVGSLIPDEREKLILKTRFQYKLNERYKSIMGLNDTGEGRNILYKYFSADFDNFLNSVNSFIRLDNEERGKFMKYLDGYDNKPPIPLKYYEYYHKNLDTNHEDTEEKAAGDLAGKTAEKETGKDESHFTVVMGAFKLWIIMPFVFLFLLLDNGEIKRFFVSLVPNRYFEVSLAVFDKVDKAIGNYLRGILIECSLVGISYIVLLALIGFEIKMAVMIGLAAGMATAIPILGFGIAFVLGSSYALIAESANSIIPFITPNNLIIAVAVVVLIVMVLDNGVFQPVVVGGAVSLHPLVVFIGIMGGSMLFGFAGLILAIPTIVVVKEIVSTLFRELKDYYLI